MTPYEYIRNHVNVKLDVSKIHGVGVFALRNIEKDEDLFKTWGGESGEYFLTTEEINSLDYDVRYHIFNMYGYKKIDDNYRISIILNNGCHWIFKTPLHWVNSCSFDEEPNLDFDNLKSKTFIKKGEEILGKYGKYNKFKRIKTI